MAFFCWSVNFKKSHKVPNLANEAGALSWWRNQLFAQSSSFDLWSWSYFFFFFGLGQLFIFHCMMCFISGSHWKHQVSSLVITLSKPFKLDERSDEIWSHWRFYSWVKIIGIVFVNIFLISKPSVKIFSLSASIITRVVTSCRTFSTFTSFIFHILNGTKSRNWNTKRLFITKEINPWSWPVELQDQQRPLKIYLKNMVSKY